VARAIFGVDRLDGGQILLNGQAITIGSPSDAVKHGIAYVPEDRHGQGLVLDFDVLQNISLSILKRLSRFGMPNGKEEKRIAEDYSGKLRLRSPGLTHPVSGLSGGNQQKVVISKWLATGPRVLILDEPTRGVDVGAKAEVHRLISELASQGLAILMISSEMPEVLGMADRVLVMHEGMITSEMTRTEATQEKMMYAAAGLTSDGGRAHD
jgi:rhamnose transport system ATP-binding protein